MKSATFLAFIVGFAGVSSLGASGQTSVAPPMSLTAPQPLPPQADAKNPRIPPAAPDAASSMPAAGVPLPLPNPATDYDGFSVGAVDDNDVPVEPARPQRHGAAKGSRSQPLAGQAPTDQDDEALKRKLKICQNCK